MGFFLIELLLLAGLLCLSVAWRNHRRPRLTPRRRRWYQGMRRRPFLVYVLVGLLALAASAGVTLAVGVPQPFIHDEFSYLLAGDTFARGRLANPPHPMWPHFEAIHIIQQPTYASKYPPAQGMVLALGQVLFGHPSAGVWLSLALACSAITWMLAGWVPLRWALLGGLWTVVRLVVSGPAFWLPGFGNPTVAYWSQSYWGGAVAALGGALVFGALPRLLKSPRPSLAAALAAGVALLATSRPFEGLVVSVPAAVILLLRLARSGGPHRVLAMRLAAPVLAVGCCTALFLGYYNFRVTGSWFTLPYQVHEATYAVAPVFLWQSLKPDPSYRHPLLRQFHAGWAKEEYLRSRSLAGWAWQAWKRLALLWGFFIGLILTPVACFWLKLWHCPSVRLAAAVWLLLLAALLGETYGYPHYAAPATCLAVLLVVEGMRRARRFSWRGRPVGATFVGGALPAALLAAFLTLGLGALNQPQWAQDRARLLKTLSRGPERHLVLVRYPPGHSPDVLWHYNRADLDGAPVVFAQELEPEANRELLAYFRDRRSWLLIPDRTPPQLLPYPGSPRGQAPKAGATGSDNRGLSH